MEKDKLVTFCFLLYYRIKKTNNLGVCISPLDKDLTKG
jgi:hypothetical protein